MDREEIEVYTRLFSLLLSSHLLRGKEWQEIRGNHWTPCFPLILQGLLNFLSVWYSCSIVRLLHPKRPQKRRVSLEMKRERRALIACHLRQRSLYSRKTSPVVSWVKRTNPFSFPLVLFLPERNQQQLHQSNHINDFDYHSLRFPPVNKRANSQERERKGCMLVSERAMFSLCDPFKP